MFFLDTEFIIQHSQFIILKKMNKLLLLFLFIGLFTSNTFSQEKIKLFGKIKDVKNGELIVGATVMLDSVTMSMTDADGRYELMIPSNSMVKIIISSFGYREEVFKITTKAADILKDFTLELVEVEIEEVKVTADVAKSRETPIAFSKIDAAKIAEELGTRDLPMVLNSTPGVYATEQGGGSGDARISIRGFNQQNVAVLVDGVPVNDMENGQVYWSNWDGLGDVTRYMQVQRGLGASKLAIVSVGGTMNIITKGIDSKMGASIKQEVNSYGLYKTSFAYNSGKLKGRWGVTLTGTRKWGDSYADATFTDAWSYFLKVQKRFNKHTLTFGVNGAPQTHGQRTTRLPIAVIDEGLSKKTGINYLESLDSISKISGAQFTTVSQGARGILYNPNYGMLNGKVFNEKVNYFHKPQFNLTHSWNPNQKLNLTTVVYASIGKGGGTGFKSTPARDTTTGLSDIQPIYDFNSKNISSIYSKTEYSSTNYLRAANNDHQWVGLLSTLNYNFSKSLSTMFGIDGRYYKGSHYQTVYDLVGGDYAVDNSDKNQPKGAGNTAFSMKRKGDKVSYNNDAFVKWAGAFGQIEYKKNKWSTFLTASVSQTSYQRIDYFKKKDLVLADTTMIQAVGYGDTVPHNGVKYSNSSPEARFSTTKEKWFLGGTVKAGANFNITKNHNVFMNAGILNIAPKMNNVFDNNNLELLQVKNQEVYSIEAGYGFKHRKFASNVNVYYTLWKNKPPQTPPTVVTPDGTFTYNINGLDALHKGFEVDFNYNILPKLNAEGVVSLGDWKTISGSKVYIIDNDNNVVDSVDFSAKNVHVGDAAQTQVSGSLKYQIIKGGYLKVRYTFFGNNYSNFDPLTLEGDNKDRESWKMPNYSIIDFNFGYEKNLGKFKFTLSGGVMNVLNSIYITDAQNGIGFNAESATVHVGMGRRLNLGLKIGFN